MDISREAQIGGCIVGIVMVLTVLMMGSTLKQMGSGCDDTSSKLSTCEDAGYIFLVDGAALESLDEETRENAYLRYNIAYDEQGKTVVMTTQKRSSTKILPMLIR